jgi:hypothetical protein
VTKVVGEFGGFGQAQALLFPEEHWLTLQSISHPDPPIYGPCTAIPGPYLIFFQLVGYVLVESLLQCRDFEVLSTAKVASQAFPHSTREVGA